MHGVVPPSSKGFFAYDPKEILALREQHCKVTVKSIQSICNGAQGGVNTCQNHLCKFSPKRNAALPMQFRSFCGESKDPIG